jgi:ABC-2 type transport system ATP-binding protein
MTIAVETESLRRTYRSSSGFFSRRHQETEAVRGVSFQVRKGELFGLLGPNGAGKTTTIKVLITLLLPTSGTARVMGMNVAENPRAVRERIGYVFGGDRGLYERLSALDNLRYFAELYGIPPRQQRSRIDELLALVGLTGRERDRVEGFSRGMRQRLHIARGLLHDPDVLFLDEPTLGIDPVGARELRATIAQLAEEGKTILLTTHYMFEADQLCDSIAVIREGQIVAQGTPAELKGLATDVRIIEIETFGTRKETVSEVRGLRGVRSVALEEQGPVQWLVVQSDPATDMTGQVLACLNGTRVGRIGHREPTLEDAYVSLVNGS